VATLIPKLSLVLYPFSILLYEHVHLKFMTKRLRTITKIYLPIMILKIFTDGDLCINTSIYK